MGQDSEQLNRAVEAALPSYKKPERDWLLQLNINYASRHHGSVDSEKMEELKQVIQVAFRGSDTASKAYLFLGRDYSMTPHNIAWWLLSRATNTSTQQALEDLYRFHAADDFGYHGVLALSGVFVNETIELADNVSLVPFDALPDTEQKFTVSLYTSAASRFTSTATPTAALIKTCRHEKTSIEFGPHFPEHDTRSDDMVVQLEDARLCLAISGPCAPHIHNFWVTPDLEVPFDTRNKIGELFPTPERFTQKIVNPEWSVKEVHTQFRTLTEDNKEWLRIPMRYVGETIASHTLVDTMINLGIAMESLFLHGSESSHKLSKRISSRAACFLGDNADERKQICELFKLLYDLRSKAVHTGDLQRSKNGKPEGWDEEKWQIFRAHIYTEKADEGVSLISKAIQRILREGEPDWDALTLS